MAEMSQKGPLINPQTIIAAFAVVRSVTVTIFRHTFLASLELELLRRVTGVHVPDYRVDDPEVYYLKNIPGLRRIKNRESTE